MDARAGPISGVGPGEDRGPMDWRATHFLSCRIYSLAYCFPSAFNILNGQPVSASSVVSVASSVLARSNLLC